MFKSFKVSVLLVCLALLALVALPAYPRTETASLTLRPAEVENALYEHPAVAECAVIGVPDPRWGEVGRAFVVLRAGHELDQADMERFLSGRLARYKVPRSLTLVDSLPRTASGKLLKQELRARSG